MNYIDRASKFNACSIKNDRLVIVSLFDDHKPLRNPTIVNFFLLVEKVAPLKYLVLNLNIFSLVQRQRIDPNKINLLFTIQGPMTFKFIIIRFDKYIFDQVFECRITINIFRKNIE